MKKFSKLTGEKVAQEPKFVEPVKGEAEVENLRYQIMSLIDDLLVIRSNGSVRKQNLNNSVSISGKEDLAEAIIDLISEKNLKAKSEVLESLKNGLLLEKAIHNVQKNLNDKEFLKENSNSVKKVERFLKTNGENVDFNFVLENWTSRINSFEDANNKSIIVDKMLEDISYNYLGKSKLVAVRDSYVRRAKLLKR
jgi:hypothetical protein